MSKADKMFEELGYVKKDYAEGEGYHFRLYNTTIVFDDYGKLIYFENQTNYMNPEIHLAIYEKLKELGWLDE